MTLLQSVILGIIQGATEFLPISSSGHLVIAPYLLGWQLPPDETFVFNILVQVATLIAVWAYFWPDLSQIISAVARGLWRRKPFADPDARMGWYLALASLPAGAMGVIFLDRFEEAFHQPVGTAIFLLCTAALLLVAERLGRIGNRAEPLSWKDAVWIGLFQALSLFPGISRSGATITGGMTRHLDRPTAARFSFLMSVPIMSAAGLGALVKLYNLPDAIQMLPSLLVGFVTAAVVGYFAIRWLLGYLKSHRLYIFAAYLVLVSLFTLISYYA